MARYNYSDEEMKDADEILKMLESESPSSPPYMKQDESIESPVSQADENYEYYDKELYDLTGEKKKPARKPDSMRLPNTKAERRDFSGIDQEIVDYVQGRNKNKPISLAEEKEPSIIPARPHREQREERIYENTADLYEPKYGRKHFENIDPDIEEYLWKDQDFKGPAPLDMDKMALEAEKNPPYRDDGKWSNLSNIDVIDPDIVAYLANLKSGERIEPYQEKSDSALETFRNLDPMGRVPATPENPGFNSYEARENFNSYQKDRAQAKKDMEERDKKLAMSEAGDLFAYAGQGRAGDIANQYLLKRKMNKDEVYGDLRENRMAREEKLRKVLEARRAGFYPVYENPNAAFDDRSLQDFRYDLNSSQARKERMDYAEKIGQLHGQDAKNALDKRQQELLKEYNDALDARGRAKNEADIKEADARIKNAEDRLLLDKDKFGADNADRGVYKDAKGNWQKKALPPGAAKKGKQLPVAAAASFADSITAIENLYDLSAEFNKNEDNVGLWDSTVGKIGAAIGMNNSYAVMQSKIDANIQAIGTFLENGKLTDADFEKYKNIGPKASDTEEVANKKLSFLMNMVKRKQQNQQGILGDSGYDVSAVESASDRIKDKTIEEEAEKRKRKPRLIAPEERSQMQAIEGDTTVVDGKELIRTNGRWITKGLQ